MKYASLAFLFLVSTALPAQVAVPAGTVLPLRLDTGLNAGKIEPGKVIRAEVMQDIPGTTIHKGTHVLGQVVTVTPTNIELRFQTLVAKGRRIPITTNLRALASYSEVDSAQLPGGEADSGLSPSDWTTQQIGGESVYRGGGPVARGTTSVGEPTPDGVRGELSTNPPCRAAIAGNNNPQALWLFSTDACGVYGFHDLTVEHSGRTDPAGTIILASKNGKLNIQSGSALLLRVQGSRCGMRVGANRC
jgi:hypothetical protein